MKNTETVVDTKYHSIMLVDDNEIDNLINQKMIEADLAKHPQCPKDGFQVTVYGATLWRAMLTITPTAGPIRNPKEWRDLTEGLAERLRERYDLDWR